MVTISTLWDRTTEFVDDHRSAVIAITLAGIFLPFAITNAIMPLAAGGGQAKVAVNVGALVLALWTAGGALALAALALDPAADRPAAVSLAMRRLLPMLGIAIVLGIACVVLLLPAGIALGLSGFDFRAASTGVPQTPSGGLVAFAGLYVLFFLVFVCWAAGRLLPLNAVVLAERRGLGAIGRAFALTRGLGARLFGVMLLYAVVSWVAQLAARTVFGSIFALIFGRGTGVSVASVLTAIVVAAVATIFVMLASIFGARLYLATRGSDLATA